MGARPCAVLSILAFLAAGVPCFAQGHSDVGETILRAYRAEIARAAIDFHQSPRVLASVIFAERSLNVRPAKSMAEGLAARLGYNASLGVAQVKVRTAYYVERHLGELSGDLAPCEEARQKLLVCSASGERIERLEQPFTNLLYAAAYVALISNTWAEVLNAVELQDSRVGIIATLYSLGLELPDGSPRVPHPNPKMNGFGETAQRFYDRSILLDEFPRQSEIMATHDCDVVERREK